MAKSINIPIVIGTTIFLAIEGHFCVLMLMAPSRLLRRVVDEIILYYRMDNESTHFQSYQYLSDSDDSDTHIRSEIPRLSCDQPSIGSLTGVLYTSPTPVSLWVPIQTWPGWAPL